MNGTPKEKILVVDNNLQDLDLIARQALTPLGYAVKTAEFASTGIQQALAFAPDVLIANLRLPDLSGKDLLVALNSQGIETPVILMADEGMEHDLIQAFRLGATDYLSKPLREAEVVSAVERALSGVRARRERETLARQLEKANQELQRRVRELTTIFSLGKAVTSITNQQTLFKTIVDGAVSVSEADRGYLLTRDERNHYILSAYHNLPQTLTIYLDKPLDDGISSLVALSGETLTIHGAAVARFKISQLGQSAMVVPVKAQKETIGLLVMLRREARPFSPSNQTLLEAVADYASISLVNARLFQALEDRARRLQQALEDARAASPNS
jgi:two-component system NtrC family sensor kinase